MQLEQSGLTQKLAQRACALRHQDIPPIVLESAKYRLLDWLGVAIAGTKTPAVRILVDQVLALSHGGYARLIGYSERVPVLEAAMANGVAGHALEFDDVHDAFGGHPTAPIAPALFAASELRDISGPTFLRALIVGTELECSISAAVGGRMRSRGFHPTAVVGALGAAGAVGTLLGLSPVQMHAAIGIAACQAAGLTAAFGTMVKALQVGKAAADGARAALLAQRGYSSPAQVLEHPGGFAKAHGAEHANTQGEGLDGYFALETLFKDYPCCFALHGAVDAALCIRASPSYDSNLVRRIEVFSHIGTLDLYNLLFPKSAEEARFSLPYAIALVLAGGDPGLVEDWDPRDRHTHQMDQLMRCVHAKLTAPLPGESCTLKVVQSNDIELTATSPLRVPFKDLAQQWSILSQKFNRLAAPVIGKSRSGLLLAAVDQFDTLASVSEVLELATRD